MTNPERCPKCGDDLAEYTPSNDGDASKTLYECGVYFFGDYSAEYTYIECTNMCLQRQLDQQREQLQSLAERVKVLEKGGEHE